MRAGLLQTRRASRAGPPGQGYCRSRGAGPHDASKDLEFLFLSALESSGELKRGNLVIEESVSRVKTESVPGIDPFVGAQRHRRQSHTSRHAVPADRPCRVSYQIFCAMALHVLKTTPQNLAQSRGLASKTQPWWMYIFKNVQNMFVQKR